MPEHLFTARADGFGWTPAGAKGWAAVASLGVMVVANFVRLAVSSGSIEEMFAVFLSETSAMLMAFFWLCLATGEPLPALQERLWFKAKRFGWGWSPATPEGWAVVVYFLAGLIGSNIALVRFRPAPPSPGMVAEHFLIASVLAASLIGICYRTGEKPGWRWG